MHRKRIATAFAILAASLYAINIPLSKLLMRHVGSTMMAAFLYLGAGLGMAVFSGLRTHAGREKRGERLTRKELPYTVAMVLLDIAAPILLMAGVSRSSSASVSLLNNFEIVATSLIALVIFRETISRRLWIAIALVTVASAVLSFERAGSFSFSGGSLMVLGACVCWGFENNCTRMLSNKSSEEIVVIKGCFSGMGSLAVALALGEALPAVRWVLVTLLLGFVAYGLSINFYILAQKDLGAAKTSAYYSIAPFLGVTFSLVLLGEALGGQFYVALTIMTVGTVFMVKDTIELQHSHVHVHIHAHEHRHGNFVHTHEHAHQHSHLHAHSGDASLHNHGHSRIPDHNHAHTPA